MGLECAILHFQPRIWQGSSSSLWCWNVAKEGQWTVFFLFESTNFIPGRSWWSTKGAEPAADVNLPLVSLCWLPRMFSWPFQLACSTDVFLIYWEIIVLPLKSWPLARKEECSIKVIVGTFCRRACLFSCGDVEGQCDKQHCLFLK